MREDFLRGLIAFFFRYLWIVCGLMITINFASMMITAYSIMENSAEEALISLSTDLSHRIEVNYELLNGLKELPQLGDTSIPVQDRAVTLKPFAHSFDLWMIGVVDPDGMISSTLNYSSRRVTREYIPRIVQSRKQEMTDLFPAGATGDLNYTQLVPVIRDGKVVSIVFTATLLTRLNEVLERKGYESSGYYLLLDSKLNVISHPLSSMRDKNMSALAEDETFFRDKARQKFLHNIRNGTSGSFISWFNHSLFYTAYKQVQGTRWILIHRIRVLQTFKATLIGFGLQAALYFFVFSALYLLGTKYVKRQFEPVNNMLKQVIDLNKTIHNTDIISSEDAVSLLNISHKGLKDELTDLPTRMLFRQMLNIRMQDISQDTLSAIFYIDMDNLKSINDTFGHKLGDAALIKLGKALHSVTTKYNGICSRYGGDEFMMFIEKLQTEEQVRAIASELLSSLHGTVEQDDVQRSFHASIGIGLYPVHAKSIDVLIQLADIALYEVKQNGKAGYAFYLPESPAK